MPTSHIAMAKIPKLFQQLTYWPTYSLFRVLFDYKVEGLDNLRGLEGKGVIFASGRLQTYMDENTTRRFDGIVELWKRSWQSIIERRDYEWRVAFTLWAAFAALIGLMLTNRLPGTMWGIFIAAFLIGLFLCILHALYLDGVGKRHFIDREIAFHYERILQALTNSTFDAELESRLEKVRDKQKTLLGDWSRKVQISVTVVLFISVLLVILAVP